MAVAKTKTDGGSEYSRSAYLIVGDPASPSTWKVRTEDSPGHTSIAQLGRAAAALTKGFRGRKVSASAEQIAAAKKKLIGLYEQMDASPPASLKATESDSGALVAAEVNGELSYDDKRSLIQDALTEGMDCCCAEPWPYIADLTDVDAIVRKGDDTWRYPYTIDGDEVAFGTPVQVRLSWRDLKPAEQDEEAAEGEGAETMMAREQEPGSMAFVTSLEGMAFSDPGPKKIEVCRDGEWDHPEFGHITITPQVRDSFVANFVANVRKVGDLPTDYDHKTGPASGWIRGLTNEGSTLFAEWEPTARCREAIEAKEYRFFSPEWHPNWRDPETGKEHGGTLLAGGVTNRPFFRGQAAIQCSEVPASSRAAAPTGALETKTMPETQAPPETPPGAQTLTETPAEGTQQFAEMERRLQAIEVENAGLKAAEQRRKVTDDLGGMRFSEGRQVIVPASRTALADALMTLPSDKRGAVVEAVKNLQFADLSTRGFTPAEEPGQIALTASEEANCERMAKELNTNPEDVKATFLETKREKLAAVQR